MNEIADYCREHMYPFTIKREPGLTLIGIYNLPHAGGCLKYSYTHDRDDIVAKMILEDLEKVCSLK